MMVICLQPRELRLKTASDSGWSPSWQLREVLLCVVFSSGKTLCDVWDQGRLLVQMFGAAAQQALKSDQARKQLAENYHWPGVGFLVCGPTASHLLTRAGL